MMFLSTGTGLLATTGVFGALLVVAFVFTGLAATASSRGNARGVFVVCMLFAKLLSGLASGAVLLSLILNVIRFAKAV